MTKPELDLAALVSDAIDCFDRERFDLSTILALIARIRELEFEMVLARGVLDHRSGQIVEAGKETIVAPGRHSGNCAALHPMIDYACDCGLDDLEQTARKLEAEKEQK